jgi:hypothetical protein
MNIKYIFLTSELFILEFDTILIQGMNLPISKARLGLCEALSYDEALIKIKNMQKIIFINIKDSYLNNYMVPYFMAE